MSDENVDLLPILLNGKAYQVDPSGTMAISTDGKAVSLAERESDHRFR